MNQHLNETNGLQNWPLSLAMSKSDIKILVNHKFLLFFFMNY